MIEKEISELRRRFKPDKSNISAVRGCYVNEKGEIISQFTQSIALMPEEEAEKLLTVLKKTLSGTLDKNLIDVVFSTQQVVDSQEHRLLMALRDSKLGEEQAIEDFFQTIIQTHPLEGNYIILLAHDTYDVPYRSSDGQRLEDAATEVFSYILCSICPIKELKSALSYDLAKSEFRKSRPDWLVAPPELGFLFPAFDERSANLYNALYYSRDITTGHSAFIDAVFHAPIPMLAAAQKETFQAVLTDSLAEDCSYGVVQAVHEQICGMIAQNKANKEEAPLAVSKGTVKRLLQDCGVSKSRIDTFEETYNEHFGAEAQLPAQNIVDAKAFAVCTPDVTIHVKPECANLVQTRVIDGMQYLLIRADQSVEINGVSVQLDKA